MSQLLAPPTSGSLGMSQVPAGGVLKLWECLSLRHLKIYEDSPRGARGGPDAFTKGLAFDTRTPLCSPLCSVPPMYEGQRHIVVQYENS